MNPIETLKKYLSIASISTDPNYKKHITEAHQFVEKELKTLGFEVEVVMTNLHPIILAKHHTKASAPHVMMYAHYDVQPADPFALWKTPPFEPRIENGKIFARGATDNKGPFITQLYALHKLFKKHPNLPLNITFLIEGEEEIGSPSFPHFLETHKDLFKSAHVLLVSDTTAPSLKQWAFTTGLRGLIGLEVILHGPSKDLHSGLFGGPVMNPIRALAKLLSSLHDDNGLVNVPNFYDGVSTPQDWEREELAKFPVKDKELKEMTGVSHFCKSGDLTPAEAIRLGPTLEFNGIYGGYQGEGSKTIIPSKATVKITCRLVPEQNPEKVLNAVIKAITERCPKEVTLEIHKKDNAGLPFVSIPPSRSNSPSPYPPVLKKAFEGAHKAIEKNTGNPPLYLREGGSIPIMGLIKSETGLNALLIGLSLGEDGMHSPNESFHLETLETGSNVYCELLESLI